MSSISEYYLTLQNNPNNISFWYPQVENCGIETPRTVIVPVPENICMAFFMDHHEKDIETVVDWVKTELMSIIEKEEMSGQLFIKNGTFSNKFSFSSCNIIGQDYMQVARSLIDINYTALMFGADGCTEIALREFIPFRFDKIPCIYKGMPLRNEYRVFYNFDTHEALYVVNYWDWDYCYKTIARDATDKIVYEAYYPILKSHYEETKDSVMTLVTNHMKNVNGLSGIWSVDIMEDENGKMWLIDMALGHRSAYWNPVKAGITKKEE